MSVIQTVTGAVNKVKFKAIDHSPEICMIVGAVSLVASLIETGKSVIRFQETLDTHNKRLAKLDELCEKDAAGEEVDTEELGDLKHARMSVYIDTGKEAVKTFWKPAALAAISVVSFCSATGIVKKRYGKLATAFATLLTEKRELEKRVEEKYGSDELLNLKGLSPDKAVVDTHVDEKTGEVVTDKVTYPGAHSMFCKFFDESNPNWEKSAEANRYFLQAKERYFNRTLQAQGYLYLNDVYRGLGMEETQEGQMFGWIWRTNPTKDDDSRAVDFGIFNADSEPKRAFVNGFERSILLEFNCDEKPIVSRTPLRVS